jgi:hypothetical protein
MPGLNPVLHAVNNNAIGVAIHNAFVARRRQNFFKVFMKQSSLRLQPEHIGCRAELHAPHGQGSE